MNAFLSNRHVCAQIGKVGPNVNMIGLSFKMANKNTNIMSANRDKVS